MWRAGGLHVPRVTRLSGSRLIAPVYCPLSERWASSTVAAAEDKPQFRKLLVANRGEIAVRVLTTARRMGIRTVAVYSEADRNSQHVKAADEAYCIGPPPSNQSYLVQDRIIDVAQRTGAEAIHPGYGFLSENAEFAQKLETAGITFIGPPASAIIDMGEKPRSKHIMTKAGVPCVPGYDKEPQDDDTLRRIARETQFPLMLKASVGGGGKGMRIAMTMNDFDRQLAAAREEAMKSFGDDRMLFERYIPRSRHVEVQVFADKHGNAVYLFERDCSVQRRHQKVIEEAPAPGLSPELRRELGEVAVRAAKAVGYVGAGTVEFIMDTEDNKFYFMEMNTRLQVEHPITEMITGQDLVEWQIRVAAGERLPRTQEELSINGHAFEARIYAEDALAGFRPGSGRLLHMRRPKPSPHIRVDTGVEEGDLVSVYYDPMIAKLIVHGPNRRAALSMMTAALHDFHIAGLTTNVEFVAAITTNPSFEAGDVSTGLIGDNKDTLLKPKTLTADDVVRVALGVVLGQAPAPSKATAGASLWSTLAGFRTNTPASRNVAFTVGEAEYTVVVRTISQGTFEVDFQGAVYNVTANLDGTQMRCSVGDRTRTDTIVLIADQVHLFGPDGEVHAKLPTPSFSDKNGSQADIVVSPLDGSVTEVLVSPGDVVEAGQTVLRLNSMKMVSELRSPRAGVVASVNVEVGTQTTLNSIMLTLEPLKKAEPAKK